MQALRHICQVERAEEPVRQPRRCHKNRRRDEVDDDVLEAFTELRQGAADQQQTVRRDQHHLERDEQVEQVAGQKRHIDAHQQKLQQRGQPQSFAGAV